MSRFTRWRERQRVRAFQNSISVLGEVKTIEFHHVDYSEAITERNPSERNKNGVVGFSRMTLSVAPLTSERIIKKALGGLVKPNNKNQ